MYLWVNIRIYKFKGFMVYFTKSRRLCFTKLAGCFTAGLAELVQATDS